MGQPFLRLNEPRPERTGFCCARMRVSVVGSIIHPKACGVSIIQ